MRAIVLFIFCILSGTTAFAGNNIIAIKLINPASIKLSELERSEKGYSLSLSLKIEIYNQLQSNLELQVIQDNKELAATTIYYLDVYDSENNKLMVLQLTEDFTGTNTLLLRPKKNLTIPLARSSWVIFPGVGKYKVIGTFIFSTENSEKYKVSSEPFILNIIK